jgi:hypothetical protein
VAGWRAVSHERTHPLRLSRCSRRRGRTSSRCRLSSARRCCSAPARPPLPHGMYRTSTPPPAQSNPRRAPTHNPSALCRSARPIAATKSLACCSECCCGVGCPDGVAHPLKRGCDSHGCSDCSVAAEARGVFGWWIHSETAVCQTLFPERRAEESTASFVTCFQSWACVCGRLGELERRQREKAESSSVAYLVRHQYDSNLRALSHGAAVPSNLHGPRAALPVDPCTPTPLISSAKQRPR